MLRIPRVDVGGEVYHVLNRANARVQIFSRIVKNYSIKQVLRNAGRPKKGGEFHFSKPDLIKPNHQTGVGFSLHNNIPIFLRILECCIAK